MDTWEFNAPTCGDIIMSINGKEYADDYFDVDHESNGRNSTLKMELQNADYNSTTITNIMIKQEVISPIAPHLVSENDSTPTKCDVPIKQEKITPPEPQDKQRQFRRRSMSAHAIMESVQVMPNMSKLAEGVQNIQLSPVPENHSQRTFHGSTKSMKSFLSSSSQTNLHKPHQFVSMAEAIYHMEKDTPERFHSYPRNYAVRAACGLNQKFFEKKILSIPRSPCLVSKTRARAVKVLSQKELDDLEVEKLKKIHIKANPVPKSVLQGVFNLPAVQRKPPTQPSPFNLTQVKKKPPPPEKKNAFTARPVPKQIYEKPQLPKKNIPVTIPKTPNFASKARSRSLEDMPHVAPLPQPKKLRHPLQIGDQFGGIVPDQTHVGHSGVPLAQKTVSHPCKPKPFSFEQRDKERQNKKMERIQQYFEEEKKMREFHANPLPAVIKKTKGMSPKTKIYEKKCDIRQENKENVSEEHHVFKARSATVVHKEPFVPVKKERPILEPCPIQLNTENRARERDAFNQKVKDKEEQLEILKAIEKEKKLRQEEDEKAALRSLLVHKAAPVKHYAPVNIQPSNVPLTRPESPKFLHKTT